MDATDLEEYRCVSLVRLSPAAAVEAGVPHSLTLFHRDRRVWTGLDQEGASDDPEAGVRLLIVRLAIFHDILTRALQNPSSEQKVRRESYEVPTSQGLGLESRMD